MAQETGYIILDVRRPDEFAAGHIPNAINVPNETIGTAEIPELPNKDQLIMVYCRSGRRSKEASEKLVKLGYTNIVEFGGSLIGRARSLPNNEVAVQFFNRSNQRKGSRRKPLREPILFIRSCPFQRLQS